MPKTKEGKKLSTVGSKGVNLPPPSDSPSLPPIITSGDCFLSVNLKPIQRSILALIRDLVKIKRISNLLSRDPKTIRHHLEQLEKFNLVTYSGNATKCGVWRITNEGKQLLIGGGKIKKTSLTTPPKIVNKNRLQVSLSEAKKRDLTDLEKNILTELKKGKSQSSLALKYNVSKSRISTIKRNIEKKLSSNSEGGHNGAEGLTLSTPHEIRLHKEQWRIEIISKESKFDSLRVSFMAKHKEERKIDNNTVRVWSDIIEVYSNTYFLADTPKEATAKGLEYWNNFFRMLEDKFKVTIFGNDSSNIKRVRCEYAELNNELSKNYNKKDVKVKIYSQSGKLWFMFDNSFNLSEAEAVDSDRAEEDITKLTGWFNDIRDNEVLAPSQLQNVVNSLAHSVSTFHNEVKSNIMQMSEKQERLDIQRSQQIETLAVSTGNLAKISTSHENLIQNMLNSKAVAPKSTEFKGSEVDPNKNPMYY